MAIKSINIDGTEHELQTTIANVEGLQEALEDLTLAVTDDGAGNVTMLLATAIPSAEEASF